MHLLRSLTHCDTFIFHNSTFLVRRSFTDPDEEFPGSRMSPMSPMCEDPDSSKPLEFVLGNDTTDFWNAILSAMRQKEQKEMIPIPAEPYLQHRRTLVEWMIEVCAQVGLSNVTVFRACKMMDRVFHGPDVNDMSNRGIWQV